MGHSEPLLTTSIFADIHRRETLVDLPRSINVTDACRITEVAHCLNCAHSAASSKLRAHNFLLVIFEASLVLMLVSLSQKTQG